MVFAVIFILNFVLTYASYDNINNATTEELEKLEYIDRDTADKIQKCIKCNDIKYVNQLQYKINLQPEQWKSIKKIYK